DYMLWFLGEPQEIRCMASKASDLEVDVEDSATILLRFPGGGHATVHMDFVQRAYARNCKLVGERGTIVWDYPSNQRRVFEMPVGTWEVFSAPFAANDMYLAEVQQFLECVKAGTAPPVSVAEAAAVLRVALAAKAQGEAC